MLLLLALACADPEADAIDAYHQLRGCPIDRITAVARPDLSVGSFAMTGCGQAALLQCASDATPPCREAPEEQARAALGLPPPPPPVALGEGPDPSGLTDALHARVAETGACWTEASRMDPALTAQLELTVTVAPGGRVTDVGIDGAGATAAAEPTGATQDLAACVGRVFGAPLALPALTEARSVRVPLAFPPTP